MRPMSCVVAKVAGSSINGVEEPLCYVRIGTQRLGTIRGFENARRQTPKLTCLNQVGMGGIEPHPGIQALHPRQARAAGSVPAMGEVLPAAQPDRTQCDPNEWSRQPGRRSGGKF